MAAVSAGFQTGLAAGTDSGEMGGRVALPAQISPDPGIAAGLWRAILMGRMGEPQVRSVSMEFPALLLAVTMAALVLAGAVVLAVMVALERPRLLSPATASGAPAPAQRRSGRRPRQSRRA